MELKKKIHLLWRASFGPNISDFQQVQRLTIAQLWNTIKDDAKKPLAPLLPTSTLVQDNYGKTADNTMTKVQREEWNRSIRQQSAKDLRELNALWIDNMVGSSNQLAERMSFFWHNHFAIRQNNSFLQNEAINIIRKHAIGSFRDLLREVSKSGAMILSLNNQQNRKQSPNENFAREIMELFSMGIGAYTEQDIKEAARAFTGWTIDRDGYFTFRRNYHDSDTKTFLGKTGKFDGDDIIDILLNHPQTATFIVTKVYRYFVSEQIDANRINRLAQGFRKDYDILTLLDNIFQSDGFYDSKHIGARIKTPVELIVGARRLSPIQDLQDNLQYSIQKLLGQILFYPPSIAGWPSDTNWIDNSTLLVRLQFPYIMNGTRQNNFKAKSDDDVNMGMRDNQNENPIRNATARRNPLWTDWANKLSIDQLIQSMLVKDPSHKNINTMVSKLNNKEAQQTAYAIMGLPEYQLC